MAVDVGLDDILDKITVGLGGKTAYLVVMDIDVARCGAPAIFNGLTRLGIAGGKGGYIRLGDKEAGDSDRQGIVVADLVVEHFHIVGGEYDHPVPGGTICTPAGLAEALAKLWVLLS